MVGQSGFEIAMISFFSSFHSEELMNKNYFSDNSIVFSRQGFSPNIRPTPSIDLS